MTNYSLERRFDRQCAYMIECMLSDTIHHNKGDTDLKLVQIKPDDEAKWNVEQDFIGLFSQRRGT